MNFADSYIWNLPTKVLFGPGQVKNLRNEKLPGKKALLVISNGNSVKANGSLNAVKEQLKDAGVEYVLFDKIPANPTEPVMMEGVELARSESCDFVIGLGGGSVLDSATVIAAVTPQKEGRVWDYVKGGTGGGRELAEKSLPYVEITTSAGTGSEVDRWGVVTNPETCEKIGFQGDFPTLAIVDPELMVTVPPDYTAYQGFDALFHSLEGYISKVRTAPAQMVEIAAIGNIAQYLPLAVADGSDMDARTKMAFANTMSGYSMELGSCTSEHSMEHAMSGHHPDLPHGAGLIMISEAYFKYFIDRHVCDDRFMEMAMNIGVLTPVDPMDFIYGLRDLKEKCGVADLKMSDYGITPDEFPTFAKEARTAMGGLFECDLIDIPEEDVIKIYEDSYK